MEHCNFYRSTGCLPLLQLTIVSYNLRTSITSARTGLICLRSARYSGPLEAEAALNIRRLELFPQVSQAFLCQYDHCPAAHPALSPAFIGLSVSEPSYLHMSMVPKCAAPAPAQTPLYLHPIGHAFRRQRLHNPHDVASTSLPIDKGHAECPTMEPQLQRVAERRGGRGRAIGWIQSSFRARI